MTIRARLTAWYTVALAAGLTLFAAAIWFSMRSSLIGSLNMALADSSLGVAQFIKDELEGPYRPHLKAELAEFAQGLPQGMAIEVKDGKKAIVYSSVSKAPRDQLSLFQHVVIDRQEFDIRVIGSLATIDETLRRLGILLLASSPLVLLLASAGGYWLSRRALQPVTAIIDAAQTVSIDNLSQRLEVPRTGDELQRLSETWNAVLARLEAAVNRLSQFTADASHELRTPLAVIRATAELAVRKSRSPEAYRAALDQVVAEADRMTQLVEDLLFLARSDAGAGETPHAPLDLARIANEACAAVFPLAQAKQIALTTRLLPAPVNGNAASLRRLAFVLLDNALKYTPSGGRVDVSLEANRFIVSDTGIGIEPDALPHIFERFFQADVSRSSTGYGLGLAQAQSIAARHHARIQVTSTPGAGSVFEVTFPEASSSAIPAPLPVQY